MSINFKDFLNEETQQLNEFYRAPKVPKEFEDSSDMEGALDHIEKLLKGPMMDWAKETDSKSVKKLNECIKCLSDFEDLLMDAE